MADKLDNIVFKVSLLKPMLIWTSLIALWTLLAIRVNHWHDRPHWAESIVSWNGFVDMVLVAAWLIYVQVRRRKFLSKH